MTAIDGLRRLPLLDPDGPAVASTALLERTWDRPCADADPGAEVDLDLAALERAAAEEQDADGDGDGGAAADGEADDGLRRSDRRTGGADVARRSSGASPWFRPTLVLPVVAAALAGALGVAVLAGGSEPGPGPGEAVVTVDGVAVVTRVDGDVETVTDATRLDPGDRLDVTRGAATFELADDVRLEGAADTSVTMAVQPRLRAGELLVDAPEATTVRVGSAAVAVADGSAARLGRTFAVQVDVYRGSAEVATAGVAEPVPALRAVEVAAPGEVGEVRPLAYEADDPWDRRYLADAVALDGQLAPLAASMRAAALDPAALRRDVAAELPGAPTVATIDALAGDRAATLDQAIGLAVIGHGAEDSLAARWRQGQAFHDDGAPWGLVALELAADPDAVGATLRRALDLGTEVLGADVDRDGDGLADPSVALGPDGTPIDGSTDPAGPEAAVVADPAAPGAATPGGQAPGGTDPGSPGGGGPTPTVPGGNPTPTVPPVAPPPVTIPPVTVPPVTVPVVTPIVDGVVEVVDGVVGVVTAPLTPILGPGGLLPILPGPGGGGLLGR